MSGKKLEPQEAFNLVEERRRIQEQEQLPEELDVESGFGSKNLESQTSIPSWKKLLYRYLKRAVFLTIVLVVIAFYIFIWNRPEANSMASPAVVEGRGEAERIAEVEKLIEKNLRSFLGAANNTERVRYIFGGDANLPALEVYYRKRGQQDVPLWKIDRIEPIKGIDGDYWFVVYTDLKKQQNAVSFQRQGDKYLLHWFAMKAFCELPWTEFIVERPKSAKLMRGYIRQYSGLRPVGLSEDKYDCFIIEDREGLFSELAFMQKDALGFSTLRNLAVDAKHPVTLELSYEYVHTEDLAPMIRIHELVHLRWEKTQVLSILSEE